VNVPGPVAANMLRDIGADIAKVEPPNGDLLSHAAPSWYAALCEGIEVLRLDLKSGQARGRLDECRQSVPGISDAEVSQATAAAC
jgi:alpha-methylacyl-CoA racemase